MPFLLMTDHLNKLNVTLQGTNILVHELYFAVNAFEQKLDLIPFVFNIRNVLCN